MQNYYRKFEKLFFLGMLRSGIGTGVCCTGALGFGNKRHKSGGSLIDARPIDLAKPMKHGMVALHSVAKIIKNISKWFIILQITFIKYLKYLYKYLIHLVKIKVINYYFLNCLPIS